MKDRTCAVGRKTINDYVETMQDPMRSQQQARIQDTLRVAGFRVVVILEGVVEEAGGGEEWLGVGGSGVEGGMQGIWQFSCFFGSSSLVVVAESHCIS